MSHTFDHCGPTDPDSLPEADRLVLHVESDESTRAAVAASITGREPDIDLVAVGSDAQARPLLSDHRFDCVVVGDGVDTGFLEAMDAPVVLYTATDPANVDESVLSVTDTLVERQNDTAPEFLARKVVSLTGTDSDRGRAQYALARAVSNVSGGGDSNQFIVDDDGRLVWASAPFEAVFPTERLDAALPRTGTFDERLHALLADAPDAIPTVTRTRRGVDATGRESFTLRAGDDEFRFVHAGYRLPAEIGSLRLEVFEDVTREVRQQARTELLELLVSASKDGLYTLDTHGNIEFCNGSFAEMLGYDREALIGRHASTVLVEGELKRGQSRLGELLDGDAESATVDLRFRTREGATLVLSIHFTLLTTDDGSYAGLMGVARDVSERKRRERELERYRQLVEAARDPMFVLDEDGRLTLFNESMQQIVDADSLSGEPLTRLFPWHDCRQLADILSDLRTGETEWAQYELRLPDESGADRIYEATVGALRDTDGFVGTVGTLRDITARERRTAELDLLKQVLSRVLRHNIRSQFTVIQSYADRLVEGTVDPEAAGEAIQATADSLLATSEKAGEIERLVETDAGRTTLDLADVVSAAVDNAAKDYPEQSCEIDVPSVPVRAHPSLVVAVENAVENAVLHTTGGPVRIGAAVTDDTVELCVSDDGPGIPETELAAIEQREETPLQHTSGAGLWLIDWVVLRSEGSLSFDTDGDGTTVRIELERGAIDNIS